MSPSQKAGTPGRRTQRAPAKRANRHAAISFAAQRHFLGAGLTPAKPNRGKALEGPPADQRALRISTAPSTHLFRLNRRHALHHTPPARRHILRRPAALLRSRTDARQTEPRESVGGSPADQRALRISTAPSTHLFRLNRRHRFTTRQPARRPFRAHHRQAPFLSASPISFQRDTALHVKPSPGKSTFRPLFAPSAP